MEFNSDIDKMTVLISGNGRYSTSNKINSFVLSFSDVCIYSQGPAGTRGPEGRQGEKGTKVTHRYISSYTYVHINM